MDSVERQTQKRVIKVYIASAIAVCLVFIHAATWDQYFLNIIPIKIMKSVGMASGDQLQAMVKICEERMIPDCQEEALESLLQKDPSNLQTMASLARLKGLLKKDAEATAIYKVYFAKGGASSEAAYKFARLLEKQRNFDAAEEFYLKALREKPDVLQITVNEAYVRMLISKGEHRKALKHIKDLRNNGAPKYFLSTEYSEIEKTLGQRG